MFYFDPMYILFAFPALLLVIYAQMKVQRAYAKYTRVRNRKGLTGYEAAQILIRARGLRVRTEIIGGNLTDQYDPRSDTMRLSEGVARTPSIASLAVVAHELGHAEQDQSGYSMLQLRSSLVPVVQFGSSLGYVLFFLGIVVGITGMVWVGVALFSAGAIFALVTLPVERDASARALRMLRETNLVGEDEIGAAKEMLSAASLTYVAALAQALSQLLYFVFLAMGISRSDRRRF